MTVEQIGPWIDLLTWQVLALIAGVLFLPAVYLLVFRIRRMKVGDNEFELGRGEIKKLENAAENKAEGESTAQAAQEVDQLAKENPADIAERMSKKFLERGHGFRKSRETRPSHTEDRTRAR